MKLFGKKIGQIIKLIIRTPVFFLVVAFFNC